MEEKQKGAYDTAQPTGNPSLWSHVLGGHLDPGDPQSHAKPYSSHIVFLHPACDQR